VGFLKLPCGLKTSYSAPLERRESFSFGSSRRNPKTTPKAILAKRGRKKEPLVYTKKMYAI